jgi:hypothetical protein
LGGSTFGDTPALLTDDPDLARVVAAWPTLPPAMRRAILVLVEAR